jgi:hypothetical protein
MMEGSLEEKIAVLTRFWFPAGEVQELNSGPAQVWDSTLKIGRV